jgi:DNA-directed RNA polymerase specialized sigma24 family protein
VINHRKQRAQRPAPLDTLFDVPDTGGRMDTAEGLLRELEPMLKKSLLKACDALDAADCRLLLWRFDEGLQLGEIARRLGVHQSTVTRRIERICEAIKRSASDSLASQSRMSMASVAECLQHVGSGEFPDCEVMGAIRRRAEGLRMGHKPVPAGYR